MLALIPTAAATSALTERASRQLVKAVMQTLMSAETSTTEVTPPVRTFYKDEGRQLESLGLFPCESKGKKRYTHDFGLDVSQDGEDVQIPLLSDRGDSSLDVGGKGSTEDGPDEGEGEQQ